MGTVNHDELRRSEDRLDGKIDDVRKETRDTIKGVHDRVNDLDKAAVMASAERKETAKTAASNTRKIEAGEAVMSEIHQALGSATVEIKTVAGELKTEREARHAERPTDGAADESAAWWSSWRANATPQNFFALVLIVAALSAWVKGQSDNGELLEAIQDAQQIQQGMSPMTLPEAVEPAEAAEPVTDPAEVEDGDPAE